MAYTIEQLEDALVLALDGLKASLGVRTIKTYQGELAEADLRKIVYLFPAIFVVWGGSQYSAHGSRKVETGAYNLFVCDRNLRDEAEVRRGGSGNTGVYAILHAIRDLLFGEMLGLEIYPIVLIRETPIWFDRSMAVWNAEYQVTQGHLYPC
jgi:Mu-like prophage protein gp37